MPIFGLANAKAMGDLPNASVNYRRAFELDKTFTEAKEAMDRLSK
jgi:hypothetical protein